MIMYRSVCTQHPSDTQVDAVGQVHEQGCRDKQREEAAAMARMTVVHKQAKQAARAAKAAKKTRKVQYTGYEG